MKPDRKKEVEKILSQEEYERRIKELQDELEELKKVKVEDNKPKKGEIWKPDASTNEYYYYINELAEARRTYNCNESPNDKVRMSNGNYYKTQEEAEYQAKVQAYTNLFRKYVEEHSKPLNWTDIGTSKWLIKWSFYDNDIIFDCYSKIKSQGVVYASSKEILDDAIEFIGKDNIIKYVLGVKED